jgi:Ca2+-binding RTX toxin-like protein
MPPANPQIDTDLAAGPCRSRTARRPALARALVGPLVLAGFASASPLSPAAAQGARIDLDFQFGNIIVTGTNNTDLILAGTAGAWVMVLGVDQGGITLGQFPKNAVDLIAIDAHDGDDFILINHDVRTIMNLHDGDNVVVGSPSYDDVQGGDDRDVVYGRSGGGSLWTGDGADGVVGGAGVEQIGGGLGNDALIGDRGNDTIFGIDDDDLILGGFGDDHLDGRAGNDLVFGGPGIDEMFGDNGDDILCGGTAGDSLFGGRGDDHLFGEEEADRHDGGVGNDELYGDPAIGDAFANGNVNVGNFLCIVELEDEPPVIEASSGTTLLVYSGYLYVGGSDGDDTIEVVAGAGGVTATVASAGEDPVVLEAEAEGPLVAVIVGAAGNDEIDVRGDFLTVVIDGGEGDDRVSSSEAAYETGVIVGDTGNDVLTLGGSRNLAAGGEGNDVIRGGGGPDYVNAEPGEDVLELGEEDYVLEDNLRGEWPAIAWIGLAVAAALVVFGLRLLVRRR